MYAVFFGNAVIDPLPPPAEDPQAQRPRRSLEDSLGAKLCTTLLDRVLASFSLYDT